MDQAQQQRVFAAIADPTRREILTMLGSKPMAVHELSERFDISRPGISKHLRILKEAALVSETKQGRRRLYQTRTMTLQAVQQWLSFFWEGRLTALQQVINNMED